MAMKNFLIISVLIILLFVNTSIHSFVIAAENQVNQETRTISDFVSDDTSVQSTKLKEFMDLSGEQRNQVIENSRDIVKQKNTLIEKVAREISQRTYNEALRNEVVKKYANLLGPELVSQINKFNLVNIKDYGTFKNILQKTGIDLNPKDLNKLEKGSLIGFDSSDLKWTTKKGKDGKALNVIGNSDAGVWLNLEDIPMGTQKMEYDSKNKQFILTMKDGGKITLGKGSISDEGKFQAFSKVNTEGLDALGNSFFKNPDLNLFDLKNIEIKKGNVIIGEDKIELMGETQIKIGEYTFNRKSDESSQTSIVKFNGNKIFLTGTEMRYDDLEKIGSTSEPFMYIHGDYKKEAIKITSMEDAISGYVYGNSWKKIYQKYDESGKLVGLSEDGKTWIGLDDKEGLNKLSGLYGEFTKSLVKHILAKDRDVTYQIMEEAFYTNAGLKAEGRQLLTEELYDNFYARNGNQVDIGGKGSAELLKSIDLLRVHDATDFKIQVGKDILSFDSKGVSSPTKTLSGDIEIPFIDQLSNNQVIGKYSLTKDSSGNLIFNDNRQTVYVGGTARTLSKVVDIPTTKGSKIKSDLSYNLGLTMSDEDFNSVKSTTEASSNNKRETMIESSMGKNSIALRANFRLDAEGVTINSGNFEQFIRDNNLGEMLTNSLALGESKILDTPFLVNGVFYKTNPAVFDTITNALIESGKSIPTIDLSKFSVEISRDSSGASQLTIISGNNGGKSYPLIASINGANEDLGNTAFEVALRAPDASLGDIPKYKIYGLNADGYLTLLPKKWYKYSGNQYGLGFTRYAFESQMGSGRFGISYEKWSRMMFTPDTEFFKGKNGIFNRWIIPQLDSKK